MRSFLQVLAFFFPRPVNAWLHQLAGAKIGRNVTIHPGVLIIAREMEVGADAKIRFGTMINVRSFKLGEKSLLGYHINVKGMTDLHIGPACVIGPKTMINCDCPVIIHYYSGVGPDCCLFTHGSFLPVSEGYRVTFGPIELKSKSWVTMRSTIGPGVTIGEGTNVMPGTILLESVGSNRLVSGNPAKLINIPLLRNMGKTRDLNRLGREILESFSRWIIEQGAKSAEMVEQSLRVELDGRLYSLAVDREADIVLVSTRESNINGMYFNIATLRTDGGRNRLKGKLEGYLRLYYGMTFLDE